MTTLETVFLVVGIAAIGYAIWRPSIATFTIAGIINLIAISLRLVG